MRAYLSLPLIVLPFLVAGCNTPPIPPGKPVDISTALEHVLDGLCDAQKNLAARQKDLGVAIDSITVELDLTVDGTKNPPVAVAPDIQFIPTVSYGQIITATKGSRLMLSFRNTGANHASGGIGCHASGPAN
ncbi:hypothetical protein [Paraburkholderia humisilvae]|uniref:Uncharacterized protein n=1 Tax=Paraburkholderia humisilvae TaxID=627669 RepID=A0A6J5CXB1_9BURK|nr:hypothetical protein [Paraburkholderia humisilvae]CAB3745781.1 hypothetical protein LMG29542_00042 [Paraburkholderia humisilvae]